MKLAYRVVFPFELRLFNTIDDAPNADRLYRLWAIVVHIGQGLHHGHYVAIIKSGDKWLLFDDDTVSTVEESDIQRYYGDTPGMGSGYVLFYEACDLEIEQVMPPSMLARHRKELALAQAQAAFNHNNANNEDRGRDIDSASSLKTKSAATTVSPDRKSRTKRPSISTSIAPLSPSREHKNPFEQISNSASIPVSSSSSPTQSRNPFFFSRKNTAVKSAAAAAPAGTTSTPSKERSNPFEAVPSNKTPTQEKPQRTADAQQSSTQTHVQSATPAGLGTGSPVTSSHSNSRPGSSALSESLLREKERTEQERRKMEEDHHRSLARQQQLHPQAGSGATEGLLVDTDLSTPNASWSPSNAATSPTSTSVSGVPAAYAAPLVSQSPHTGVAGLPSGISSSGNGSAGRPPTRQMSMPPESMQQSYSHLGLQQQQQHHMNGNARSDTGGRSHASSISGGSVTNAGASPSSVSPPSMSSSTHQQQPPTARPQHMLKNATRPMSFAASSSNSNNGAGQGITGGMNIESKMPSRQASASVSHNLSSSLASSMSSSGKEKEGGGKKWWKLGKK